jgi:hypothetical protein
MVMLGILVLSAIVGSVVLVRILLTLDDDKNGDGENGHDGHH